MFFFKGTGDSLVYFRKFLPENIFWVFFYSLFFEDVMLNYEAFCLSQVSAFSAPKKKCILANIFKWFQVHYKKLLVLASIKPFESVNSILQGTCLIGFSYDLCLNRFNYSDTRLYTDTIIFPSHSSF